MFQPSKTTPTIRLGLSGFTLIEIIVVVLILGLITLSITVNFSTRVGMTSQATGLAHRVQQVLNLLQDLSIFHNQEYGATMTNHEIAFYQYRLTCDLTRSNNVINASHTGNTSNTSNTGNASNANNNHNCHLPYYWQRIKNDSLLRQQRIPSRLQLQLTANTGANTRGNSTGTFSADAPQIIFKPSGEITPFILEIQDKQQKPYFRLQGQKEGTIEVIDLGRLQK